MNEEKNSEVFLRPRFKIDLEESEDDLMNRFKNNLNSGECKYCSKIVDGHIVIDVPFDEDHFWSPQLNVEIVKGESTKSIVKGLFGPKPQVWTLFMFLHFAIGITFLIFLTLLYVRWTFDSSLLFPTIMVIILPIIWVILYFFGRWGRRQGKQQMEELHCFMMKTLARNNK
ncbi:MAG: GTP-binding protein [Flavobacteriaceae bacterium]|nr:MAG: GTP-binding protein [Flavobacteriaceae bacterium]